MIVTNWQSAKQKNQIPFDLSPDPDLSLDSFIEGESNREALTAIRNFANWPAPWLFLIGPQGAGKTHLGQGWAAQNGGICLTGIGSSSWPNLAKGPPVFLDGAEKASETALFALANRALNGETSGLVLAAIKPPAQWNISMPDLRSRLRNIPIIEMMPPGDDVIEPIIRKLLMDRGREVRSDLTHYIATHYERSPKALKTFITELDLAASVAKRDLTRNFAVTYLKTRQGKVL